jgi:hypothetical protein
MQIADNAGTTDEHRAVSEKFFTRVDVTEEFPFLITVAVL